MPETVSLAGLVYLSKTNFRNMLAQLIKYYKFNNKNSVIIGLLDGLNKFLITYFMPNAGYTKILLSNFCYIHKPRI